MQFKDRHPGFYARWRPVLLKLTSSAENRFESETIVDGLHLQTVLLPVTARLSLLSWPYAKRQVKRSKRFTRCKQIEFVYLRLVDSCWMSTRGVPNWKNFDLTHIYYLQDSFFCWLNFLQPFSANYFTFRLSILYSDNRKQSTTLPGK